MQLFGMDEERIRYILTQPSYKNRSKQPYKLRSQQHRQDRARTTTARTK
jgi:hypothetical protein